MTPARPRLQSLIFEVTPRCNHACLHCYNDWHGSRPHAPASPELDTPRTLALLAKALDETDCPHVTLSGGEPLLRPDLGEIAAFLQDRGVGVTVISNGRLLTEAAAAALLDRGVALFELPLLGSRRELHDHLSASPGAWDAVLSAMAGVRLLHGQFIAAFVATRLNIDDLHATIRLAFAFGARGLMLNRFNPGGRGREHLPELLPSVAQLRRALSVADAAVTELGLPISCSIPIQPCLIDLEAYPHLGFGFCAAGGGRAYYTLDASGDLRPCNHSTTVLGNLFRESFASLIAPGRLADFVDALPEFCLACSRRLECQGGCKAAAQVCCGSLCAEEPFLHHNRQLASIPV